MIFTKQLKFLVTFAFIALAGCVDNYDDCVLDKVEPGMSNAAAMLVVKACRNKYPLPKLKHQGQSVSGGNYFDKYDNQPTQPLPEEQ